MPKWNDKSIDEQIKRLAHVFQIRRGRFLTAFRDQKDNVPVYNASDSLNLRFNALKSMMALLLIHDTKEWLAAVTSRVHQVMYYEWYLNELRVRQEECALECLGLTVV